MLDGSNYLLLFRMRTASGMHAEISYDLVMEEDMSFVEGTYRLAGGDWQVVIVSAFQRDVPAPQVVPQRWDSGVSGLLVRLPLAERINAATVERVLSEALGVSEWVRVRGPDSMQLRQQRVCGKGSECHNRTTSVT